MFLRLKLFNFVYVFLRILKKNFLTILRHPSSFANLLSIPTIDQILLGKTNQLACMLKILSFQSSNNSKSWTTLTNIPLWLNCSNSSLLSPIMSIYICFIWSLSCFYDMLFADCVIFYVSRVYLFVCAILEFFIALYLKYFYFYVFCNFLAKIFYHICELIDAKKKVNLSVVIELIVLVNSV